MSDLYNTNAPKKAVNVSINSDLLQEAKTLKINLSATLEQELVHPVSYTHLTLPTMIIRCRSRWWAGR